MLRDTMPRFIVFFIAFATLAPAQIFQLTREQLVEYTPKNPYPRFGSPREQWIQHEMPQGYERPTLYGADGSRLALFGHSSSSISFAEVSQ